VLFNFGIQVETTPLIGMWLFALWPGRRRGYATRMRLHEDKTSHRRASQKGNAKCSGARRMRTLSRMERIAHKLCEIEQNRVPASFRMRT
jgi:hypothetical protein